MDRRPPARPRMSSRRVARHASAVIAILVALVALWALKPVLLLLFSATLVAVILDGAARKLSKVLRLPHGFALAIGAVLIVAIIGGIGLLFGRELANQLNQLIGLIPGGWNDLSDRVGQQRLNGIVEKLAPSGSSIFSIIQSVVTFVGNILSALLLALLGGVFLATQPRTYRRGVRLMLPERWEDRADEVLGEVGTTLRAWLRGQLVSMVFVGVGIFAGLVIVGAPSPLALAVIAALLGFVPVIGPLMAAAPGVLVGLTMGGDSIWQVILVYFVVQQIDGNLVNPMVMRHTVKIPPAVTMFSLFAIGAILGSTGLLLGGPITVLAVVLVRELWIKGALGKRLD
ncbi:AI-2E family transporter [uncultured Sphingomonas sp.]|uniref:AI-2E family transporter n=1 Tax=uncultured Sphingomonas sp. TaxID=158754 RepID=UPI003749E05B